MIVFIICAVVGSFFLGFIACALLSAERVIPRLPKTQLIEQAYKNGYKQGGKDALAKRNPPNICKAEFQAVDVLAVLTSPWPEPGWVDTRRDLAEKVGRQLLQDGLLELQAKRDGIKMETEYMARARVLKPKGGT